MGERRVHITIESQMEHVAALGSAARAVCATFGLSKRAAGEVELSLVEVVNNCIEHAYRYEPNHRVEVLLTAKDPGVQVEVSDRGRRMPSGTLEASAATDFDARDLMNLPEGRMGLGIVKRLMQDVRYESINGVNVLSMSRWYTSADEERHDGRPRRREGR